MINLDKILGSPSTGRPHDRRMDHIPYGNCQSRMLLSSLPEAAMRLSGEMATLRTHSVCPSYFRNSFPVLASHNRTVPSHPPDKIQSPSGEKVTPVTERSFSLGAPIPFSWPFIERS